MEVLYICTWNILVMVNDNDINVCKCKGVFSRFFYIKFFLSGQFLSTPDTELRASTWHQTGLMRSYTTSPRDDHKQWYAYSTQKEIQYRNNKSSDTYGTAII